MDSSLDGKYCSKLGIKSSEVLNLSFVVLAECTELGQAEMSVCLHLLPRRGAESMALF